jgi:hypothetical protein
MIRLLFWIGDVFERGVPDDYPLNRFQMLCFRVSQAIYRCVDPGK